jgi:hypothetical protein
VTKTKKSSKRRTQTRKLAPKSKQLGQKEMKNVKGGIIAILIGVKEPDPKPEEPLLPAVQRK